MYLHISPCLTIWWYLIFINLISLSQIVLHFLYSGTRLLHRGSLDVSISPIKARGKRIKFLCKRPNCGVKWVISIYSMMEYSVWDTMQDVKLVPFFINLIIQSGYVSIMVWLGTKWYRFALKQKFCDFDRIFITSCTRSCQNDNLQYSQRWKFRRNDSISASTLRWRHNGNDCVSNHQPHHCLLNRLFGRRSKKTSKLRGTGLCVGKSPGPVNSPHKWPVTRKMFPFDDVIMSVEQTDTAPSCRCNQSPFFPWDNICVQ